jgi:hypothetical protein
MSNLPPLLPHREHGHARPFWLLSNVDADLSLVQVLELLTTYDTELTDLTMAQGATTPPPAIMDMINIVTIAPAELLPNQSNRNDGRPPPPRTNSYLLLPRAGAIMVDPHRSRHASHKQAHSTHPPDLKSEGTDTSWRNSEL